MLGTISAAERRAFLVEILARGVARLAVKAGGSGQAARDAAALASSGKTAPGPRAT